MPFKYQLGTHKNNKIIFIICEKNQENIKIIKSWTGSKWSQSNLKWYVPDNTFYREQFKIEPTYEIGKAVFKKIDSVNSIELKKLQDQLVLHGYSPNTIRTYLQDFAQFLYFLEKTAATTATEEQIKLFIIHCISNLKLAENTIHARINGIKFYYEKVLKQPKIVVNLPRPKKQKLLPKTLNTLEVKLLFDATPNLKHNTILKLIYGMGLRVSEIINIEIHHIDSINMQVYIARAKGKKDRYANLPNSVLLQLREYYKIYQPKKYLFEGQYSEQYSVRSAQQIFKNAMQKAKIIKPLGIHCLRHSYATHLLENGTDIRFIQELLGHSNIKTTLLYTEVTDKNLRKITSPLDNL